MVMDTIISRRRRYTSFWLSVYYSTSFPSTFVAFLFTLKQMKQYAHHLLQCLQCIAHETNWRRTIFFVIVFAHWIYIYEIKKAFLANIHSSNILQMAVIISKTQKQLTTFQSGWKYESKTSQRTTRLFLTIMLYPNYTKILNYVLYFKNK